MCLIHAAYWKCEDTDNPEWRKVYVPDTRGLLEMCGTPSCACFCMHPHPHPLKDFKPAEWKRRNIHTEYNTTNLHTGAFMLPKYVEELLEQEEER